MPVRTVLLSIVPPVLIALAVLFSGWRPWRRAPGRPAHLASAAALALGFAIAETFASGSWPGFPPRDQHRWLPYLGVAALAFTPLLLRLEPHWRRLVATLLIAVAFFTLLMWRSLSRESTRLESIGWVALASAAAALLQITATRTPGGFRVPLSWLVTATGASIVFMQTYSAMFALLAGSVAAALGAFLVVLCWRPKLELAPGLGLVFPLLTFGLALSLPATPGSMLFLVASAAAPALALIPPLSHLRPWVATVVCVLVADLLCALALWQSPSGFEFGGY